jgi:hypothetical protein
MLLEIEQDFQGKSYKSAQRKDGQQEQPEAEIVWGIGPDPIGVMAPTQQEAPDQQP